MVRVSPLAKVVMVCSLSALGWLRYRVYRQGAGRPYELRPDVFGPAPDGATGSEAV